MKKWGVLITLSLAMFIIVIDTTIMNVSISVLVVDLNTTVTGVQSAISIYAMVMAASMLIGGKLADIIGPKRTFLIGLVIYGVGTTVASFSNSLSMLIVGWSILEGIGAALMIPTIQVLLRDAYKEGDLAFAYGIIGAVSAVGAAVGPIVGGFFTTYISWRWVEKPFRNRNWLSQRQILWMAGLCSLFLIALGLILVIGEGFDERYVTLENVIAGL